MNTFQTQYPLDRKVKYCYRNEMNTKGADPMGFIVRVEEARQRRGLGVYEFSEAIEQGQSYWSVWISRHRKTGGFPKGDIMAAMARELKVTLSYLLGLPEEGAITERPWYETASDDALMDKSGIFLAPVDLVDLVEDITLHAGEQGSGIPQDVDEHFRPYPKPKKRKKPSERFVRIVGQCMAPDLHHGDLAHIDRDRPPA